VVILNSQNSEWLALTLEVLLDFPEEQDFVKSFQEGSKVLIARRGENKARHFLEATSFGLGGRKGSILIPEGRGGWGWLKFFDKLRKVVDFLSVSVGCGLGSSSTSEKKVMKDVQPTLGLAPKWTGPSFVEVLRLDSTTTVKALPIVGGSRSWLRASLAEPCEFDLFPAVWHAEADSRSAVDCYSLESHPLDLLDKDQHVRPQGKYSRLNFENSRLRTWRKLGPGFYLALGRAIRRVLDRFARSGLNRKPLGFLVAQLLRKPKVSCPPPSLPEKTPEVSSRVGSESGSSWGFGGYNIGSHRGRESSFIGFCWGFFRVGAIVGGRYRDGVFFRGCVEQFPGVSGVF
jgi:hypothetical protein